MSVPPAPGRTKINGVPLRAWINGQRRHRTAGKLTPGQIADHDALGMEWDLARGRSTTPADHDRWRRNLATATRYVAEHGHLSFPSGYQADGLRLDAWLSRQRAAYRNGTADDMGRG